MGHELQERYSKLVLARIRKALKLKDGVVFNNNYEGSPTAGAVKIPVRDIDVAVTDYDKANGITATQGSTSYVTMPIDKDKAMNELIDGYDAKGVPDNLVADRMDSGSYSMAAQIDNDGATVLLAGATVVNVSELTKENIYSQMVDIRTAMSKANIPDDGRRYFLATSDTYALILKSPEYTKASDLGDKVVQEGVLGRIAGFNIIEWNDDTANLAGIAGHPDFATRAQEFSVPVHVQDLNGSGKYIGACAVQGREVYAHKVLRSVAIRSVFAPGSLILSAAAGATAGTTKITVTGNAGSTLKYVKNPSARAVYNGTYTGTALTSGTTEISVAAGDVIEVVELTSSKVSKVGYITIESGNIATA